MDDLDVLLIGDDDCTSVAIGSLSKPRLLEVVDYDIRVVDYIEKVAERHGLPIKTRLLNVSAGAPDDMLQAYDCVVCDPVPTGEGLRTFFLFARAVLRSSGILYISAIPTDAPNLKEFHAVAAAAGFLPTDMVDDFSRYPGDATNQPEPANRYRPLQGRAEFTETWVRLVQRERQH